MTCGQAGIMPAVHDSERRALNNGISIDPGLADGEIWEYIVPGKVWERR